MEQLVRKKNRLQNYDYSQNGAYFITICTEERKCLLSAIVEATITRPAFAKLTDAGKKVEEAIMGVSGHYSDVRIEKFVIMPNHIHLLLMIDMVPGRSMIAPTVSRIIKQMKGYATKQIGHPVFQKSFHDRIIRNEPEYQMVWQYIDTNPQRWEQDCFYTEE